MFSLNKSLFPISYTRRFKIPEYLICHESIKYKYSSNEECFLLFSLKNPSERAIMYCCPEEIFRKDFGWVKSLYIGYLETINGKGKGLGTKLLKFAEQYSRDIGCQGKFHLYSSGNKDLEKAPHVFYRKFGMNTGCPSVDKKLDYFVKKKKSAANLEFKTMLMFYPPIEYDVKAKIPIFKRVIKTLLSYFKL